MARVIVILALMFLISSLIFAVTRKPTGASGSLDADARTTVPLAGVPLGDLPEDMKKTVETSILNGEVATEAASTQEVMSGAVSGAAPSFATVGVDHKGRASFTGTATPGDEVLIARDGKPMGTDVADDAGNWAIEFKVPAVREDFDLHISAKGKTGKLVEGPQRALVSPPARNGGLARITLMAAELKTVELEKPKSVEPEIGLIVEKVTSGSEGHAALTGKADPGATIKAALNGASAGETIVDASGRWTMDVKNSTGKDASVVKLKLFGAAGEALDEADVPYKMPAAKIADVAADAPKSASGTMIKIHSGDSLWRIAKRHYGSGKKWKAIYKANKEKIGDPDMIFAGGSLLIPA